MYCTASVDGDACDDDATYVHVLACHNVEHKPGRKHHNEVWLVSVCDVHVEDKPDPKTKHSIVFTKRLRRDR